MPLAFVIPVYLIEAFIVWQVLEIKRRLNQSSQKMEEKVDSTSLEMTQAVANAMELGVSLLRAQLPKGEDDV